MWEPFKKVVFITIGGHSKNANWLSRLNTTFIVNYNDIVYEELG
jgi:hypothetical protein